MFSSKKLKEIFFSHFFSVPLEEDTDENIANIARHTRDYGLRESDWTQIPDNGLSDTCRSAWAVYRQILRDITTQENFPRDISWPLPPDETRVE